MDQKLARLALMLEEEQMNIIKQSKVLVIGLGGVGGYVCEALARSGIGHLVVMDHDVVSMSNLNRQIIATKDSIGVSKTLAIKQRVELISDTTVTCIDEFYHDECNIIDNSYDFIVDACDTISAKIAIIKKCKECHINLISCMGTANRLDPSQLRVMSLDQTSYDPLAKVMRNLVKKNHIKGKIMVVASLEQPFKQNKLVDGNGITLKEKYPPASSPFVPSAAGMLMASYVFKKLINKI